MELTGQILTFSITIVTGMLLGVLFDCYRILRGTFNPKAVVTWFTDLLYWLVATAVVFVALVVSNWGELRFYVFIGILTGLGSYYSWLSLHAIRLLSSIVRFITYVLKLMERIFMVMFLRPGRYCMRVVSWPFLFTYRKARSWFYARFPKPPDDEKK